MNETSALRAVQMRLTERFPALDVEVVEAAVRLAQRDLRRRIGGYVPVLVERTARDRLTEIYP